MTSATCCALCLYWYFWVDPGWWRFNVSIYETFCFLGYFFDNSMAFTSNAFPILTTRGSTSAVVSTDILLQLKIIEGFITWKFYFLNMLRWCWGYITLFQCLCHHNYLSAHNYLLPRDDMEFTDSSISYTEYLHYACITSHVDTFQNEEKYWKMQMMRHNVCKLAEQVKQSKLSSPPSGLGGALKSQWKRQ